MNIILQSKDTRRYVRSIDHWTPVAEEAYRFGSTVQALCFCHQHALYQMQVVLRFADGSPDIAFDVTNARRT